MDGESSSLSILLSNKKKCFKKWLLKYTLGVGSEFRVDYIYIVVHLASYLLKLLSSLIICFLVKQNNPLNSITLKCLSVKISTSHTRKFKTCNWLLTPISCPSQEAGMLAPHVVLLHTKQLAWSSQLGTVRPPALWAFQW